MNDDIVREFHRILYDGGLHFETRYHGIEAHKCPLNLWIFEEILFDV